MAATLAVGNVTVAVHDLDVARMSSAVSLLRLFGAVLVSAFYASVVVIYLRRRAAVATAPSCVVRSVAVVAGWLPLAFPYLPGRAAGELTLLVSCTLLAVGMTVSVLALRTLGRSFSVVPQARHVVTSGPYGVVRHPLYLGEMLSAAGVALRAPSLTAAAMWCLLLVLQTYRVAHEERVLSAALPEYEGYRARIRWRIIPGVV